MKAREEHIAIVNQKATAQLAQLSQNKAEYQNMLEKLWTQATFKLLENECVVICREGDVELIKVWTSVRENWFRILNFLL